MIRLRLRVALLGALLAVLAAFPPLLCAQQFVVFKVTTPFDMGGAVPDSGRVNDYYIKIGREDGALVGTIFNVYRDKEIVADIGNFSIRTRVFVGRMRAVNVQQHALARATQMATYSDPHRDRNAVLVGDYVQPVFVVESENLFDKGSNTLRPEAIRELDRATAFIKRFRPIKVRVEGHTDSEGDDDYNMTLSQGRAESVRDYLVSQGGIGENVLVPVGYGETKLIATSDTPEGQRKNRWFEIVIEN